MFSILSFFISILNQLLNFYQVEVHLPEQPFFGEPAPIGDKCVITERETSVIVTRATAPDDHLTVIDRGHLVNGLLLLHRVLNNQIDDKDII